MLKAISIIAVLLVLAVIIIIVVASQKPDTFHFQRNIVIKAPPEKIFPHINDLNAWRTWSPYEKKDPAMKRTMSGPPAGKGAGYAWDGNKNVGTGSMEITESTPSSKVVIKLDFIKPFEGHNVATFTLMPRGGETEVSWAMDGPAPLITKVMSMVINMDKMVGDDFADGLASLKALAEKQ
jgi:uncharacterized protein YndB with AHSA1/START domain